MQHKSPAKCSLFSSWRVFLWFICCSGLLLKNLGLEMVLKPNAPMTCGSVGGVWGSCCSHRPKHSGRGRASAVPPCASCRGVWTQRAADVTPAIWWWIWCPSCHSSGTAAPCPCLGPSQRARSRTGGSGHTWRKPACTSGCLCSGVSATAVWFSSSCWAEGKRAVRYWDRPFIDQE